MKRFFALFLAITLCVAYVPAFAYKIVFDPKNFTQNLLAAKKSVVLELQSIQQTIHQANQLYTQYQQLKSLDPVKYAQAAADAERTLRELEAYQESNKNVYKALDGQDDYMTALQGSYVREGEGDWQNYISVIAKRAASGDLKSRQLFDMAESTSQSLNSSVQTRRTLQEQSKSNVGLQQSAQTTNQMLDLTIANQEKMLAMMAEQTKLLAEQKAIQARQDKNAAESRQRYLDLKKAADESRANRWTKSPFEK